MRDLDTELRALAVEWPETPDLAPGVAARLAAAPVARRRRRVAWRPAVAYGVAALLLAFAVTMAASPDARSAVLEWLGLKSVRIEHREPRPTDSGLRLGRPVTLARAQALRPFLSVPRGLGEPEAVHVGRQSASLVYPGPLLVQEFPARVGPFIEKTIGMGASLERLRVDGAPAYFISGAHGFAYLAPGEGGAFEAQRLAGNTLLVERPDGLLVRVEGDVGRERAVAVARSIP